MSVPPLLPSLPKDHPGHLTAETSAKLLVIQRGEMPDGTTITVTDEERDNLREYLRGYYNALDRYEAAVDANANAASNLVDAYESGNPKAIASAKIVFEITQKEVAVAADKLRYARDMLALTVDQYWNAAFAEWLPQNFEINRDDSKGLRELWQLRHHVHRHEPAARAQVRAPPDAGAARHAGKPRARSRRGDDGFHGAAFPRQEPGAVVVEVADREARIRSVNRTDSRSRAL
jgi:hypothetical protein